MMLSYESSVESGPALLYAYGGFRFVSLSLSPLSSLVHSLISTKLELIVMRSLLSSHHP